MKYERKINNNVVWAVDERNEKVILFGKGIAFGKEKNQEIRSDEIERVFKADEKDTIQQSMIYSAIESVSDDVIILAEEITKMASKALNISNFDNSHFLSLADHLNFALKSRQIRDDFPSGSRWEAHRMYPEEFDVAIDALYLIEKRTGVRLPKSEQIFLTYHFANARNDTNVSAQSMQLAGLINRSVEIIQYHYQMRIDSDEGIYVRFVTHLRYLILRQFHNEAEKTVIVDEQLLELAQKNYRKAYLAAKKVTQMLEETLKCSISQSEVFYLTLHIERLTK